MVSYSLFIIYDMFLKEEPRRKFVLHKILFLGKAAKPCKGLTND